jgi:hypothetical protein
VFYVLLRALTGNRPLKHHGESTIAAQGGTAVLEASPAAPISKREAQ